MNASISLTRDSGYADRRRQYRVLIDGVEVGRIADGATESYAVTPGNHTLVLKIDWCGSKLLNFDVQDGQLLTLRAGLISVLFAYFWCSITRFSRETII